jgi:RNA polymerase sigma-70 factor (ECF subfamily)
MLREAFNKVSGILDDQDTADAELLKQSQAGDAEAFGRLYERYAATVFRFLYAHLGNRLDAEDLAEEVFLRVWRTLPRYEEQGVPFLAFLYRIARNALIDHYRRSERTEVILLSNTKPASDAEHNPDQIIATDLEHQEIRSVLGKLQDTYREVLTLRFIAGLSPMETAATMHRSEGSVRVLQHRALVALRRLLETI